jgi:acyl-CoA synthetase (AMP-forming)/AMP-acid ligase II
MGLENFLNDLINEGDTYIYTLKDILRYRAEKTPGEAAFIFLKDGENDEDRVTYGQLYDDAIAIAERLNARNLKGQRMLLLFPPGLDFIRTLFGCFLADVIAVPAYPPRKNRSLDRIRALVIDSGASTILATEEILQTFERSFSDVTELQQLPWLSTNLLPGHTSVPPRLRASLPSDTALLQYTSGSTGSPKGVIITHQNIMRNCEFIRNSFSFSRKSVAISWLPTFHDMGLVGQVFEPVYTGFPSIYMSPVSFFQKPVRWLKAFTKYRGTMGGAPNFGYDMLCDQVTDEERQGLDLSSIQTIYCGAEPIRKTTFERFTEVYKEFGMKPGMLYPCYGMAETTLITSGPPSGRGPRYVALDSQALQKNKVKIAGENTKDAKFLVGVGFPWLDTKVRIVNPETLVPCNPDEIGEIWICGSSVSPGYWNKAEENKEVFSASIADEPGAKYLRSGDLGFFHEGELYISGRHKDMIILGGQNIYPQDIEYLTENSHPALRQNASAAFSVEIKGEEKLVVVAEVERASIIGLNIDEVCDQIRENVSIETDKVVHAIQLLRVASIPKTSSGKIQRKACKEAFLQKKLDVVGESFLEIKFHEDEHADTTIDLVTLEAWMMTWIHGKLKIPLNRIDSTRPITAYGLTSMKAIALQQDFLDKFGVVFPPYLFFEKNSLKNLCEKALRLISEK